MTYLLKNKDVLIVAAPRALPLLFSGPAIRGHLLEPGGWTGSAASCDAVFHLAAETDLAADREQYQRITVYGTRAVLEGARRVHAERFVHRDSEAPAPAGPPLIDVDETVPLRPDSPAAYCAAKAQPEQFVVDSCDDQLATVAIQPQLRTGSTQQTDKNHGSISCS
jgi:nucleoside-diphosphate-sugar epimerase